MEDQRIGEVNKLFKELGEVATKVYKLLGQEEFSYELIRGDLEAVRLRKQKLVEELNMVESQVKLNQETAEKIISTANEKAQEIIDAAHAKNTEAFRLLEEVKKFCAGVDRKRQVELKDRILAETK